MPCGAVNSHRVLVVTVVIVHARGVFSGPQHFLQGGLRPSDSDVVCVCLGGLAPRCALLRTPAMQSMRACLLRVYCELRSQSSSATVEVRAFSSSACVCRFMWCSISQTCRRVWLSMAGGWCCARRTARTRAHTYIHAHHMRTPHMHVHAYCTVHIHTHVRKHMHTYATHARVLPVVLSVVL
jgi:hypothetical protein